MDAQEWDTRYSATETMWSFEPNVFLVSRVENLTPGRALDLACGEGRNALWLSDRGWDMTAVDFSEVAVERGRSRASRRGLSVDFEIADVVEYAPEPGAFDLVILFYLQIPHDEVSRVLSHAVEALAHGGTLLVVAHDLDNLERGHGGPPSGDVLYTVDLVTAAVGDLDVVEAGQVERVVQIDGGETVAIDTLVLAHKQ